MKINVSDKEIEEEIENISSKIVDPKEYESLTPEDDTPNGLTGREKINLSNLVKSYKMMD